MTRLAIAFTVMAAGFTAGDLTGRPDIPTVTAVAPVAPFGEPHALGRASRSRWRHPLPVPRPRRSIPSAKARPARHLPVERSSHDLRGRQRWLNWSALARCESGGNPHAVDPSGNYFGLYQFALSTWRAMGGTGSPAVASPTEQTGRAARLYAAAGTSPWPVCGWHLLAAS